MRLSGRRWRSGPSSNGCAGGAHGKFKDGRWPSSDAAAPFGYWVHREGDTPDAMRRSARLVPDDREQRGRAHRGHARARRTGRSPRQPRTLTAQGCCPGRRVRKAGGESCSSRWSGPVISCGLRLRRRSPGGSSGVAGDSLRASTGPRSSSKSSRSSAAERLRRCGQALTVFGPREEEERVYPWSCGSSRPATAPMSALTASPGGRHEVPGQANPDGRGSVRL